MFPKTVHTKKTVIFFIINLKKINRELYLKSDFLISAVIKDSNLNCRGPVESELQPWQAAIENPGTGVSVAIPLKKVQDSKSNL